MLGMALEREAPVSAVASLARSAQEQLSAGERQGVAAELIDRLLALKRHDEVRAFVLRLGGPERSILDDLAVTTATTDARNSGLAWRLTNGVAIRSELVRPSGMAVTDSPSSSGAAISRLTLLQPGYYKLFLRFSYDEGSPQAVLRWVVESLDGRTIWQESLSSRRTSASISTTIVVPRGCTQQSWRLEVSADDSQFASVERIDSLSLQPT